MEDGGAAGSGGEGAGGGGEGAGGGGEGAGSGGEGEGRGEGKGEGSDVREMYAYAPVRHSAGSLQFTLPNWAWQELKSTPAPAPWSQLAHWLKPPIEQPVAPQKSRATPSLSPNSALSGELRW